LNVQILHNDKHILVINKLANLPVLPDGWEPDAPYLVKMLEEDHGKIWVVHRLDKITSGVMVCARTAEAHRELNRQFEQHEVEKVYQAVVEGIPPWDEHTARHMLRTNVGHKHRTMVDHKRGKNAETYFKVLKRGQARALLEAHPKTGRTHQIRVHLSALGFPILGDVLYGAQETDLIARPALHALSLRFTHPVSGKRVAYTAPFPNDIQQLIERLNV
jgi:tRNA pseudouridine32 synthase / 23S rRNA pseudouridine746 synthase